MIKARLERERAKLKAEQEAAQKSAQEKAEQERLAEEAKWKELSEKQATQLDKLKAEQAASELADLRREVAAAAGLTPELAQRLQGKTREELAKVEDKIEVRRVSTFGLSVDHRIIDGAVAADFLQNLKRRIEEPLLTFLDI